MWCRSTVPSVAARQEGLLRSRLGPFFPVRLCVCCMTIGMCLYIYIYLHIYIYIYNRAVHRYRDMIWYDMIWYDMILYVYMYLYIYIYICEYYEYYRVLIFIHHPYSTLAHFHVAGPSRSSKVVFTEIHAMCIMIVGISHRLSESGTYPPFLAKPRAYIVGNEPIYIYIVAYIGGIYIYIYIGLVAMYICCISQNMPIASTWSTNSHAEVGTIPSSHLSLLELWTSVFHDNFPSPLMFFITPKPLIALVILL